MPDKTALASLVLATRYRARSVIIGAWLAFLVQTIVAIAAGKVLNLAPRQPVHILAGLGFIVFAVLALRRNEEELESKEEAQVNREGKAPPWLASFLVVFAAEWGDLTQLATAAIVARTGEAIPVGIGAVAALWSVTILAVAVGAQVEKVLSPRTLARASGVLFACVGIVILVAAATGH